MILRWLRIAFEPVIMKRPDGLTQEEYGESLRAWRDALRPVIIWLAVGWLLVLIGRAVGDGH